MMTVFAGHCGLNRAPRVVAVLGTTESDVVNGACGHRDYTNGSVQVDDTGD
jgi:hypothetical protein